MFHFEVHSGGRYDIQGAKRGLMHEPFDLES